MSPIIRLYKSLINVITFDVIYKRKNYSKLIISFIILRTTVCNTERIQSASMQQNCRSINKKKHWKRRRSQGSAVSSYRYTYRSGGNVCMNWRQREASQVAPTRSQPRPTRVDNLFPGNVVWM